MDDPPGQKPRGKVRCRRITHGEAICNSRILTSPARKSKSLPEPVNGRSPEGVAQICNLLYRRFVICRPPQFSPASVKHSACGRKTVESSFVKQRADRQQTANLRYDQRRPPSLTTFPI